MGALGRQGALERENKKLSPSEQENGSFPQKKRANGIGQEGGQFREKNQKIERTV